MRSACSHISTASSSRTLIFFPPDSITYPPCPPYLASNFSASYTAPTFGCSFWNTGILVVIRMRGCVGKFFFSNGTPSRSSAACFAAHVWLH